MIMQESVLYIVLTLLCVVIYLLISQRKNKIRITNSEKTNNFKYPKEKVLNRGVADIITNYKDSLILDIWLFLYNNI